ncbi:MAG: hypothetical protein HBSAPP02_25180 [Phycisphaerae bacterium]|nr:MAG: four helix bundle protein [Planctomycetia bacterium]RIK69059.1 MAG: four helix bundle protein [Planctomycetota bacterium]GJQ27486.1 MAG: hypothetical protein HBSAPP02_25180 [Phycisphaerae bacterium]
MGDKVRNFEDLAVYQNARTQANEIYRLTREGTFSRDFGLVDQIRRAAVSVISNIAEGYERGSNAELVQYLYIAKGSCGEVRAQLMIACDQHYIDQATHDRLKDNSRRISAMLANLITYVRTSGMQGPKHRPRERPLSKELQALLGKFAPKSPYTRNSTEDATSEDQAPDRPTP